MKIAFNALGPDGRPLAATMPLEVRNSAFEQVLRDAQASGELREFDVQVNGGAAALRIAQEAVNNVIRHAGARKLVPILAFDTAGLRLRVADDGCGFDPLTVDRLSPSRGLGLLGMRAS